MYLTRGGYLRLDVGSLTIAGQNDYYWAATAFPRLTALLDAYHFASTDVRAFASHYGHRWFGFTVQVIFVSSDLRASDRKAEPTIGVVRRVDASAIEGEVERIERRRTGRRGPVVAIVARDPQRASSQSDVPATS